MEPASADRTAAMLLDGAARCFIDVGVTKTTMAEIAAAAGVTKPTLYRRYADKGAVVEALVRRETAAFVARIARAAAAAEPADALAVAFAASVRWLDRHPFLRRSLAREPQWLLPLLTEPGAPVRKAAVEAYADLARAGARAGVLRRTDATAVGELLWRLALSYVAIPALGPPGGEAALRRVVHETVVLGLRATPIERTVR